MKRAVILIHIQNGEILVASRKEEPSKFGFVGGKVEDDETFEEAIIRECYEESLVVLEKSDLFVFSIDIVHGYLCTTFLSLKDFVTPAQNEEGVIPFFVSKEDLLSDKAAFLDYNKYISSKLENLFLI